MCLPALDKVRTLPKTTTDVPAVRKRTGGFYSSLAELGRGRQAG